MRSKEFNTCVECPTTGLTIIYSGDDFCRLSDEGRNCPTCFFLETGKSKECNFTFVAGVKDRPTDLDSIVQRSL